MLSLSSWGQALVSYQYHHMVATLDKLQARASVVKLSSTAVFLHAHEFAHKFRILCELANREEHVGHAL